MHFLFISYPTIYVSPVRDFNSFSYPNLVLVGVMLKIANLLKFCRDYEKFEKSAKRLGMFHKNRAFAASRGRGHTRVPDPGITVGSGPGFVEF